MSTEGTTDATIINTPDLIALAEQGNRIGFNRQLDPARLRAELDPEGTHFLVFSMMHEHINGQLTDPHVRTIWMVKLRDVEPDGETAPQLTLDVELRAFMGLSKLRRYEDGVYETVRADGRVTSTFRMDPEA
jgi:hypothetical protein